MKRTKVFCALADQCEADDCSHYDLHEPNDSCYAEDCDNVDEKTFCIESELEPIFPEYVLAEI